MVYRHGCTYVSSLSKPTDKMTHHSTHAVELHYAIGWAFPPGNHPGRDEHDRRLSVLHLRIIPINASPFLKLLL